MLQFIKTFELVLKFIKHLDVIEINLYRKSRK